MSTEIEKDWLELKRKCDYYFSRILARPLCPPEHVYFSLTNRCNLRCKMCGIAGSPSREEDELKTEECKKIIDQVVDLKVDHLILSGGEPLLRKDILSLVYYAVSKKIKMVDIITNGTLISEESAEELVNSGLNHITVSIDGLEEKEDFIRGKGAFLKAIKAIDNIKKYRKGRLPTVGINFTIMDCNIDDIIPMIELARDKGCNIIVLQPMMPDNTDMQERKKNELWVSENNLGKLGKVIKEVLKIKKEVSGLSIHVSDKILEMIPAYFSGAPLDKQLKCYEGIVRIVITCGADLWTCQGIYGNLRKHTLGEYWFFGEINKIRNKVKTCQSHCLQSCIHLPELADIYSEAEKSRLSFITDSQNKKLLKQFRSYKFMLQKEVFLRYILGLLLKSGEGSRCEELNNEIMNISNFIKESA